MKKSIVVALTFFSFLSFNAAAQTIPGKMEQLSKDPKTAERAAQADVYILGHKIGEAPGADVKKQQKQATHKWKRKGCQKK